MSLTDRTYQILVVEDNPGDTYIIGEAFRECGYPCQLTFAGSQEDAQLSLTRQSFDLLLSDFGTRIDETRAFVRYVRNCAPRLPIIVLSGSPDPNGAYDAGANAFIRKPNDLTEFFARIQGIMQFWVDIAELPDQVGELHHSGAYSF